MEEQPGNGAPLPDRLRRLTRWRTPSPRWRGVLLLVAGALFIGGAVFSFRELDVEPATLVWWPLVVVAVVGTPATIAANAAELRAMARLTTGGVAPGWLHAARVVIVATAANILPLPGGALVRVHALRTAGAPLGQATSVTLLAALLWVATSVGIAGGAALTFAPVAGVLALLLGVGGVVAVAVLVRTTTSRWSLRGLAALALVEVVTTVIHGARLWLVLLSLGVAAQVRQALVLGAGAPLAAAAGIFPSGLGLAELLSALLAPAVALPAAAGFGAAALARLVGLLSTLPFALALGVRDLTPQVEDAGGGDGISSGPPST